MEGKCDRTREVLPLTWLVNMFLVVHQIECGPLEQEVVDSTPLQILPCNNAYNLSVSFIYLFWVLRRFQHCTGHITTGSWKGRGNQYKQFIRVCTVNCRPTASNYLLSHLRPCRESNPDLRGGSGECYHSATVAPFICFIMKFAKPKTTYLAWV